jgi:hypothetical protein
VLGAAREGAGGALLMGWVWAGLRAVIDRWEPGGSLRLGRSEVNKWLTPAQDAIPGQGTGHAATCG